MSSSKALGEQFGRDLIVVHPADVQKAAFRYIDVKAGVFTVFKVARPGRRPLRGSPAPRYRARKHTAEGEALLAGNTVSHNHLNFRKDAIDTCLAAGNWDGAIRHAAAMEEFARYEPFPWSTFFAARGRALAAYGIGRRNTALTAELNRLRTEGARFGYRIALPAIEMALDG